MPTGTVKWFDTTKGFGFITPDDGSDDLFAHFSSIVATSGLRSLEDADHVRYRVGPGKRGNSQADEISIIR